MSALQGKPRHGQCRALELRVLQSQLAIEWAKRLQEAAELYPRGSWLGTHSTPTFDWTALPLTW